MAAPDSPSLSRTRRRDRGGRGAAAGREPHRAEPELLELADHGHEVAELAGLDEVAVGAELVGLPHEAVVAAAREHRHGDHPEVGVGGELLEHLEAGEPGHLEVEDDQIGTQPGCPQEIQRLGPGVGDPEDAGYPGLLERLGGEPDVGRVVFDQENSVRLAHAMPLLAGPYPDRTDRLTFRSAGSVPICVHYHRASRAKTAHTHQDRRFWMPGDPTTVSPSSRASEATDTPADQHLSVLVIEDNPADARLVASMLGEGASSGWQIATAATLRDARQVLLDLDTPPDCILLDMSLPDAQGLEGIVVLGTAVPEVAIVVVTGNREERMALAALAEGAQDFLSKDHLDATTLRSTLLRARQRKTSSSQVHASTRLARSILDAIEAPTVALDGRGRILLTNAAWRSAAVIGGVSPESVGVGVNYLDVCDEATGRDLAGAGEAATGIRSVLNGTAERFSIDYPCDMPTSQHWFTMRVTPLGALGGGSIVTHIDITDVTRAEQALRVAQPALHTQVDHTAQIFLVVDGEATVRACSELTRDLLGVDAAAVVGTDLGEWIHGADTRTFREALELVAGRPGGTVDAKLRIRDASWKWHIVDVVFLNRIDDDRVHGIVVTGSDVTERQRAHLRARLEPRLLEQLPSGLIVTDEAGVLVYWNPRASTLFGIDAHAMLGRDMADGLGRVDHPELAALIGDAIRERGRWEGDFEVHHPDGTTVPLYASFDLVELPDIGFTGVLGIAIDNTERRRLEHDLDHAAHFDDHTGLPNRRRFEQHLRNVLHRPDSDPDSGRVAVLLLGVDGLNRVNDIYGHAAGDAVLRTTADTVRQVAPTDSMVARFLGDSLVVVLRTGPDGAEAVELADRIHGALREAGPVGDSGAPPSVGIGIALAEPGDTVDSLMVEGHVAREQAKRAGRGGTGIYDPDLEREHRRRAALEAQLEGAVARGEITVWYQPQVEIDTGRILGAEALVRWEHPELGRLDPVSFLEQAEHTGAISTIGAFVLREAAARAAEWRRDCDPEFRISVNLSARQLREPGLVQLVAETLAATGLEPIALTLEITETTIIENRADATVTLEALRAIGISISIDDFGTGYSSLSYLKELPADVVKIDRSFVSTIEHDPRDRAIVAAIVSLAEALDLEVVAEGVETVEQRDTLAALGLRGGSGVPLGPTGIDRRLRSVRGAPRVRRDSRAEHQWEAPMTSVASKTQPAPTDWNAEMLQLTRAVSAEFRETPDLREALGVVVELIGRSLDVQRVFVRLGVDSTFPPPVVAEWIDGETARVADLPPFELSDRFWSAIERGARTNRAMVSEDIAFDDRLMPSDIAGAIRWGIRSAVIFPFANDEQSPGTLSVHDTVTTREWNAVQVHALEAIGREIANAAKRARAIELERELLARTRDLDNERSEFVSSVSHELRSPLTSILGYLELLHDGELGPLTDDQTSVLDVIERNGRRLLGLIEDLLAVSKVERGSFGVRFAPVDLNALVATVCETIAIRIREGGLGLTVDVPDEPCHALGDAEELERVLLNLATNAVKFTPPGGTVDIALRREGHLVRIEVTDTGIGVTPADQEHVFERFFRATHDGKKPPSGTGLGLYIVQTVVETHGGSVEFESEPGVGTRIACLLPAARISESPEPPPTAPKLEER